MTYIITTIDDLRQWVQDRLGGDATPEDVQIVTRTIRNRADCPAYGTIWNKYLDALPPLWELAK